MGITDFYERVKKLAKANKMTIETAVGQAGLSLASYNAYRRHENLPRADEAQKIAAALGTTVEYLVTGTEPENSIKPLLDDMQSVINRYQR
jgi:transcriptional regulator with XRE-family HTH domain